MGSRLNNASTQPQQRQQQQRAVDPANFVRVWVLHVVWCQAGLKVRFAVHCCYLISTFCSISWWRGATASVSNRCSVPQTRARAETRCMAFQAPKTCYHMLSTPPPHSPPHKLRPPPVSLRASSLTSPPRSLRKKQTQWQSRRLRLSKLQAHSSNNNRSSSSTTPPAVGRGVMQWPASCRSRLTRTCWAPQQAPAEEG